MPPWNDSIEAMLMILPRPCAMNMPAGGLRHEERGLDVDVHHVVPVLLAELHGVGAADQAGIVDQDVERRRALRASSRTTRGTRFDAGRGWLRSLMKRRPSAVTFAAVSSAGAMPAAAISAPASASATRHALAEAGVGAGHQSDFAFEAERIFAIVLSPLT